MKDGVYRATVLRFNAITGEALCLVPQLFGDKPQWIFPQVSRPDDLSRIAPVSNGDTVWVFFPGADDVAPLWCPRIRDPAFDTYYINNALTTGRNKVLNGAMRVHQMTLGAVTAIRNDTVSQNSLVDGFVVEVITGETMVEQAFNTLTNDGTGPPVTTDDDFTNLLVVNGTQKAVLAANDYAGVTCRLLGEDLQDLHKGTASAKPLTLSFTAFTSVDHTCIVELEDVINNRRISQAVFMPQGNRQRYSITFPPDTFGNFPNTTDWAMQIRWWLAAGDTWSGGTSLNDAWSTNPSSDRRAYGCDNLFATNPFMQFDITGVQLETGTTATPFEHILLSRETLDCMRRLQVWDQPPLRGVGNANANTVSRLGMPLTVPMCKPPIVTIVGTLLLWDGINNGSTTGPPIANYSTAMAVEFDPGSTTMPAAAVSGSVRSVIVYQSLPSAGYMVLDARP